MVFSEELNEDLQEVISELLPWNSLAAPAVTSLQFVFVCDHEASAKGTWVGATTGVSGPGEGQRLGEVEQPGLGVIPTAHLCHLHDDLHLLLTSWHNA